MSTVAASVSTEKQKIFQTVLSSPGMSEKCKIILHVSRLNILLFARLLEAGLLTESSGFDDELFAALPQESLEELRALQQELLKKGELADFYDRLKAL